MGHCTAAEFSYLCGSPAALALAFEQAYFDIVTNHADYLRQYQESR